MNIVDIFRGLPMPMQGVLMQMYGGSREQDKPTQTVQGAGAGRGFVNPPMVNPNAPRPQVTPPLPALPVTEVPTAPIDSPALAQATAAASSPDTTPDNIDAGGGQNFALQKAMSQDPGILSRMGFQDGNQALMALGGFLSTVGAADPQKQAMTIMAQQAENEKLRQARLKANQPKRDQIAGTPIAQIVDPTTGKLLGEEVSPALAAFYKAQGDNKTAAAIEKAVLEDRLARGRDQAKADIKASDEAKPLLNDIQGLKGRWQQAKEIVSGQGTMAQVQGIPGIAGIAGFFGGDEVAKNKFLEGLTVDETLLNTARTKGAISNQEMMLFKSPIPSLTDDREKVWKPWIEKRLEVLDKMEKFQAGEVARGQQGSGAGSAPPPSEQLRAAVTASGISWEPDKYQYRIGPNGQVQRKAK